MTANDHDVRRQGMTVLDPGLIQDHNHRLLRHVASDYEHLGEQLARRHIDIDAVRQKVAAFGVAIPSWGVGTGGTRFARFPGPGEPRNVFDKLQDCGVIWQLARATPGVPPPTSPAPPPPLPPPAPPPACRCISRGTSAAIGPRCAPSPMATAWASTRSTRIPFPTSPARRTATSSAA